MFRLTGTDPDVRIGALQDLSDPGDRPAGTDARAEGIYGAVYLPQDLQPCVLQMGCHIVRVLELVGNEYLLILPGHLRRQFDTVLDTLADIAGVMNELYLGPVLGYQISAFHADRIRHDNDCLIPFDRPYKGQPDALVAAGRFHNNGILTKLSPFLSLFDHLQGCPRFDRTANVHALILDQDPGVLRAGHPVELDHRRITDSFQNILIYHLFSSFLSYIPSAFFKTQDHIIIARI